MTVTVVILTLNEARHIERALQSVAPFAARCVVVDSGSSDNTVAIARKMGAKVLTHPFVNQARQFNWALDQLPEDTNWVFRLDADEVVSKALAAEIQDRLPHLQENVSGLTVPRRMNFMGRQIRYGGLFPVHVVRLFRHGHGRSEDRWMDEHVVVKGGVMALQSELIDDNLNPLSWWIEKHNRYASREALEVLMAEVHSGSTRAETSVSIGRHAGFKRWLKEGVYSRLPSSFRSFLYFFYRYVVRLGFLDGPEGTAFHVLQGFWYRYLVDAKLLEMKLHMRRREVDAEQAILEVLGIDLAGVPKTQEANSRQKDRDN